MEHPLATGFYVGLEGVCCGRFSFYWVSMDKQMATIYYSVQDLRFRVEMGRGSSALRP